jgi:hypothetical protein
MTKIFYFAYGSNLDKNQMSKRCPESKFICKAKIKDYTLSKTITNVANIVKSVGGIVDGSIYSLSKKGFRKFRYVRRLPIHIQKI